jgi:hypothetical protein
MEQESPTYPGMDLLGWDHCGMGFEVQAASDVLPGLSEQVAVLFSGMESR